MRLGKGPLLAIQRITAHINVRGSRGTMSRMNLVRTWRRACGTRQIVGWRGRGLLWLLLLLLLRLLLARRLTVCFGVLRSRQWLAVGTVHGRRLTDAAPDGVGRHKGLSLSGDGGEDAVLVKTHAVGAAAVVCSFESRAANLDGRVSTRLVSREVLFKSPCVFGSSDRQWQFAVAVREAGGAGSCIREGVAVLGRGRRWEVAGTIHEDQADGGAAGAGGDGQPCRHEGPAAAVRAEEGEAR